MRWDWVSICVDNLKQLEISESFQDIKIMKQSNFDTLLRVRIDIIALQYLTSRQGQKGGEMIYTEIEMSEYLLPHTELNKPEKKEKNCCTKLNVKHQGKFSL